MTQPSLIKSSVWGVSALAILSATQPLAAAQEQDVPQEGEFLGTLTLGESKREVQTDTPVAITVIDKEEIDDRQATTIAELIDSVPGVSLVNGSTPSGSGINIRGFGANGTFGTDQKVAVFIDGATSGSEELYRLGTQLFTDPFLYRSVEVQRGTVGSFEYGSGIVGGIVRLETIDAADLTGGEPGFKLAQTLGYASNKVGYNTSTTLAWQPTEDIELLGNFSYREQDEQQDGGGATIGNSAFELPSWLIKGRVQFGNDKEHAIEASYSHTESADRDIPYDTFITATDFFGNVDRDTTNDNFSLFYYYSPLNSDLIDLEVGLTYANQEFEQTFIEGSSPIADFVRDLASADHQYETTKFTVRNNSYFEAGSLTFDTRYGFELIERDRADANAAPGGTDDRYAIFLVGDVEI
ncbi:MAG: TonB-dependent receptor plug domain-containing protein, partial [Pseudomonadota bacterium]